ncbi:hypothetical protein Tco_0305703, partial [Tanacetum coccineum]
MAVRCFPVLLPLAPVESSGECVDEIDKLTEVIGEMQLGQERISKKRTKNEAKTTKPGTKWKSVEKTKTRQSP